MSSTVNVLNVIVSSVLDIKSEAMLVSASDKSIRAISLPYLEPLDSMTIVHSAPTLSQLVLQSRFHVATTMSGELLITRLTDGKLLHRRKDHTKFAVSVVAYQDTAHTTLATAGWDGKIMSYKFSISDDANADTILSEPVGTVELPTKPEAILFVEQPYTKRLLLVVSRTDSSHLHFYDVRRNLNFLGRQNLAPYSNAWVAFTPSSLSLSPTDPTIIAVATNSTPHMKLLVVQLLTPNENANPSSLTATEQAREDQAVADKEDAAIKLHCNTMAPQTPYSTPLVVWRPHGKGVWVNSDDGVIRGIDTISGKVVEKLKAHDDGSKVRALWSGSVGSKQEEHMREEWLVSGAFDHNLVVWRAAI